VSNDPLPPTPPAVSRRRTRIILGFSGFLLAAVIAFLTVSLWPTPSFQWLSYSVASQSTPPGKFAIMRGKLLNLTAPLWKPFRRNRRQIQIGVTMSTVSSNSIAAAGLGLPIATNMLGTRAWLLGPGTHKSLERSIDAITGASPAITISDGGQASIRTGIPTALGGTNEIIYVLINLAPKSVSESIRLDVGVDWISGHLPPPKANLFSCRVFLSKTATLAIDCPQAACIDGTHLWFEFYPIVIDSTPNKPKR
jgi:hypothetical protein